MGLVADLAKNAGLVLLYAGCKQLLIMNVLTMIEK